jgi:hypothetical protein
MGIPIIFEIAGMFETISSRAPAIMFATFPLSMILFMGVFFGWLYALGANLNKKLPNAVKMSLIKFQWFIFIPLVYMTFICVFIFGLFKHISGGGQPNLSIFAIIVPLHLFSMYCIFYCLYFVAKSLKAVELQRTVTFDDYAGEFFLIWFFPIGVWILQPRINKILDNTLPTGAVNLKG